LFRTCDDKFGGFAFAIAGEELGKEVGISDAAAVDGAHHISDRRFVAAILAILTQCGLNVRLVRHSGVQKA